MRDLGHTDIPDLQAIADESLYYRLAPSRTPIFMLRGAPKAHAACHENGGSIHEKSKTYEQLAIFMLRGAPEAHDACRKIPMTLKIPQSGANRRRKLALFL
jgi:hypothetical protein